MSINVKNVTKVANAIESCSLAKREKNPIGFNMDTFGSTDTHFKDHTGHHCGTNACIAGWTVALLTPKNYNSYGAPYVAQDLLGLNDAQANRLFYALGYGRRLNNIKPALAVAVLRNLAKTGEVNWNIKVGKKTPTCK